MSKMKAYQINCPGCGAVVNADLHNNQTVCPFCHNTINIDNSQFRLDEIRIEQAKNRADAEKERDAINNDYLRKRNDEQLRSRQRKNKTAAGMFVAIFVVFGLLIAGALILPTLSSTIDTVSKAGKAAAQQSQSSWKMATDIDQIPQQRLDKISSDCLKKANAPRVTPLYNWSKDSAEVIGHYLACTKNGNFILTVVEEKYSNAKTEKNRTVYKAYASENIGLNADGTSEFKNSTAYCKAFNPQLMLDNAVVYGRESLEELYLDLIGSAETVVNVTCTDGLQLY